MKEYKLNIGDLRVVKEEAVTFTCLGLGSCIGLFMQDRSTGLSGGAHILLPAESTASFDGKYYAVKQAVNEIIRQFRDAGSSTLNLRAKITGGAKVVTAGLDTGRLNTENVVQELVQKNVYIAAMDVGGRTSRTARFNCISGELTVRIPETNEYRIY
jgi:chemotaxis protein CheD